MTRAAICLVGLLMLAAAAPRRADAQFNFTQMSISGFPLTQTGTSVADFDAGAITLGTTTFTVDLTLNIFIGFSPRVTTVRVRCATPCPASGSAAASRLEWRRINLATWNVLTTSFVDVETRTASYNGSNDPWSNSIAWRYRLGYTDTPASTATQFNIQFQLQVTAP
ncbi:MAG TPA: hypothetical protein PK788_02350 [Gemmatimonadaceae bacterium]|nr:hypothetical protein [Gemmatimonadaceae bacterium]HRQ78084.1 hypothetical protein [Gemmatimonadaceae bacterium]